MADKPEVEGSDAVQVEEGTTVVRIATVALCGVAGAVVGMNYGGKLASEIERELDTLGNDCKSFFKREGPVDG